VFLFILHDAIGSNVYNDRWKSRYLGFRLYSLLPCLWTFSIWDYQRRLECWHITCICLTVWHDETLLGVRRLAILNGKYDIPHGCRMRDQTFSDNLIALINDMLQVILHSNICTFAKFSYSTVLTWTSVYF
jgi:hypothetical protein